MILEMKCKPLKGASQLVMMPHYPSPTLTGGTRTPTCGYFTPPVTPAEFTRRHQSESRSRLCDVGK